MRLGGSLAVRALGALRVARGAIPLALSLGLLQPGAAIADWPVYGHDLANSRSAGREGPPLSEAASLRQAWTFSSSNGDFTGTPVVADGTLVAGTGLGTVYALDGVTGKLRWSRDVGDQINGSAAIDPDAPGGPTVFVPIARLGSPHLVALSLRNGAVRWDSVLTSQPTSFVFGSPVYWHRTVYMGTSGGNGNDESTARGSVVALDEANGNVRWRTFTVPPGHDGGPVWSTPAIDTTTGRLYVGTGNAYHDPAADTTDAMLAMSATDGRILGQFQATPSDVWELNNPTGGPDYDFGASPNLFVGPAGRRLVGEGQKSGIYWSLDPGTMQPVWQTMAGPGSQLGGGILSSAYDGTRIYGSDAVNGDIFALGVGGSMLWRSSDTGPLHYAPVAVGNGVLYSVDPHGFLMSREATTGAVLGRLSLNTPLTFGGISLVGRAAYVVTGTGPPSPLVPVEVGDTSRVHGPGTIVALGDTSQSGATGCVRVVGAARGRRLGPARLGRTRAGQRRALPGKLLSRRNGIDRYCADGGGQMRIGYPTPRLRRTHPSRRAVRRASRRAVLVLTSSPAATVGGVRPGSSTRSLRVRLRGERRKKVGRNIWYLAPGRVSRLVFKTRRGGVLEVGIASKALTRGRRATRAFLRAWQR